MQTQLVITLMPDGRLGVQGPIDNKLVCFGMLELAKDVIRDHNAQPKAGIVVASPALAEQIQRTRPN